MSTLIDSLDCIKGEKNINFLPILQGNMMQIVLKQATIVCARVCVCNIWHQFQNYWQSMSYTHKKKIS